MTVGVPAQAWVGPELTVRWGESALEACTRAPEHLLADWAGRVGDPVPLHTPYGAVTGDEVLEGVTRQALRCALERAGHLEALRLLVLVPDDWSAHQASAVRRTVAAVAQDLLAVPAPGEPDGALEVATVPALQAVLALLEHPARVGAPELPAGPVLVLDIGASAVRSRVVEPGAPEPAGPLVVDDARGGRLLDHRLFRHLLGHVPPALLAARGSEEALRELVAVREACRRAREQLSLATEVDVPLRLAAAGSNVRLVRAELEDLLEPDLAALLAVGEEALDRWRQSRPTGPVGDLPDRLGGVLLLGGVTSTPRLVQLASARWGVPVARPTHPGQALLHVLAPPPGQDAASTGAAEVAGGAGLPGLPVGAPATAGALVTAGAPGTAAEVGSAAGVPGPTALPATGGAHAVGAGHGGRRLRTQTLLGAAAAAVLVSGAAATIAALPDAQPTTQVRTELVTRTATATVTIDATATQDGTRSASRSRRPEADGTQDRSQVADGPGTTGGSAPGTDAGTGPVPAGSPWAPAPDAASSAAGGRPATTTPGSGGGTVTAPTGSSGAEPSGSTTTSPTSPEPTGPSSSGPEPTGPTTSGPEPTGPTTSDPDPTGSTTPSPTEDAPPPSTDPDGGTQGESAAPEDPGA